MMRFEDYFSLEAIVGDLVRWRLRGKDVGGTLPPRKMWSRAGVKERKGVDPAIVRKQSILRTVRRACGGAMRSSRPTGDGGRGATAALPDFGWGRKLLALVEAVRPTNMARRRIARVPYSEL